MVYAGDARVGLHHLQAVPVGLPVVDDDGQPQLLRQLHLGVEHLPLELTGGIVFPVIVQSNLPDGPDLWMGGQGAELAGPALLPGTAVRGVNPHGGVDKGKPLRQLHRRFGALQVTARVQNQLHTLLGHGGENLQPVGVEGPGVVVGVGVK